MAQVTKPIALDETLQQVVTQLADISSKMSGGGGGGGSKIYGATWDGSADSAWERTDDAVGFEDPQPYYSGMSGTPSSPFDNIQPWAGMVRSMDATAGEVVAIPKFYYKMGYADAENNLGLKIQIAPASNGDVWATSNGFSVSPAHVDRGDGKGERDIVYLSLIHI